MARKKEIPTRCGLCEYMVEVPAPDEGISLFACSHKASFDNNQIALFVMPGEKPPEFCGLMIKQKELEARRKKRSLRTFFNKIFHRSF